MAAYAPCGAWRTQGTDLRALVKQQRRGAAPPATGEAEWPGSQAVAGGDPGRLRPAIRSVFAASPPPGARRYGRRGCHRRSPQRVGWESDGECLQPTDRVGDRTATVSSLQEERCLLYTSPSPRDGLLSRMPS